MKPFATGTFVALSSLASFAHAQAPDASPEDAQSAAPDTRTPPPATKKTGPAGAAPEQSPGLPHLIHDGKVQAGLRTYVMATQNDGDLQDWQSWAAGGRLGYQTARLFGFGAGASAYVSTALVGNAGILDPSTSRASRYELGLYDVEHPRDREVAYLGEAYVDFEYDGHLAWAGRHRLKSPLLNPQDGRMIPTLPAGLWYRNTSLPGLTLQGGYLSHIAPRSSGGYRTIEQSFGIYPVGRNPDGTPSDYADNVRSHGLFVGSAGYEHEYFEIHGWDYFTENVFNAVYADAFLKPRFFDLDWRFGFQTVQEQRVADGGNSDPNRAYFQSAQSQVFDGRIEAATDSHFVLSGSYERITADGRFLFPREWGRESLFVFQKRERSEGSGDEHAFLFELGKTWNFEAHGKLRSKLGYGHYYRPDPTQAPLNKYALPSLRQVNLDTFFHFGGPLDGLVAELLVTYKGSLDDTLENPAFVLNKVNLLNWNFIVNYDF